MGMAFISPVKNLESNNLRLDAHQAFKCWIQGGSIAEGMKLYKRFTGNSISDYGLRYAAKRWVIRHPEEAREVFKQHIDYGDYWKDDDNWNERLVEFALSVYGQHKRAREGFLEWIDKNGLQRYSYLYEPRINSHKAFAVRDIS